MSFIKQLICDDCGSPISCRFDVFSFNFKDDPDTYLIGHMHMCEECQRKKLGYFKGDSYGV